MIRKKEREKSEIIKEYLNAASLFAQTHISIAIQRIYTHTHTLLL
jgi:hypothetical protein